MRHAFYILNDEHEPVAVTLMEWAAWYENFDNRAVARFEVGPLVVSTVFLGLDHSFGDNGPPLLFETMVFHSGEERGIWRSYTWDGALERHNSVVAFLSAELGTDGHAH